MTQADFKLELVRVLRQEEEHRGRNTNVLQPKDTPFQKMARVCILLEDEREEDRDKGAVSDLWDLPVHFTMLQEVPHHSPCSLKHGIV